jgi:hypothetical protein
MSFVLAGVATVASASTGNSGNSGPEDCPAGTVGVKVDPPVSWTNGNLQFTVVGDAESLNWTDGNTGPYEVVQVLVKGGNATRTYDYAASVSGDTGLVAPVNSSGQPAQISHYTVCWATTTPDTTTPETTVPETTVPEVTVPETTVPDTTTPEVTVPETSTPDSSTPGTTTVVSPPSSGVGGETDSGGTASSVTPVSGELPPTGSFTLPAILLATGALLLGGFLILTAKGWSKSES